LVMGLAFLSPSWILLLVFLMFLLLLKWFTTFFLFASLLLTTPVLSNLTLRLPASAVSPSASSSSAFAVTPSSTTWHRRLGHPGRDVLAQLRRSTDVPCTRAPAEHLCHACQLGRHVRLPFSVSSSHAAHAFDLIHCDLWTSPVLSMSGYRYYLVIVDDFS